MRRLGRFAEGLHDFASVLSDRRPRGVHALAARALGFRASRDRLDAAGGIRSAGEQQQDVGRSGEARRVSFLETLLNRFLKGILSWDFSRKERFAFGRYTFDKTLRKRLRSSASDQRPFRILSSWFVPTVKLLKIAKAMRTSEETASDELFSGLSNRLSKRRALLQSAT